MKTNKSTGTVGSCSAFVRLFGSSDSGDAVWALRRLRSGKCEPQCCYLKYGIGSLMDVVAHSKYANPINQSDEINHKKR